VRVLVTGGGGQLATAIERSAPPDATVDVRSQSELDVADADGVRRAVQAARPDVIVNTAAYTAVDKAESEPALAFLVNGAGALHVAQAAVEFGARIVHISTDFVFDGSSSTPYAATAVPCPVSVYGASKLQGERLVLEATGGEATVIRTAWLHSADGANFTKTMLRLLAEREEVNVVTDQVGTPTWARSLARAIWAVARRGGPGGVQHYTDAGVASWYDFAVAIAEEARAGGRLPVTGQVRPIPTSRYPTAARRPAYSVLDCGQTWRDLGVEQHHWRDGVRAVIRELEHA
jgi:dTDP-4-dehydrorhamnose reductase